MKYGNIAINVPNESNLIYVQQIVIQWNTYSLLVIQQKNNKRYFINQIILSNS